MNRVARTIEKTGAQRNGDVELGNLPDENANVEDFVLREEAQADFSRLIERAALAPREREVIEHLRGGSSYAEIARQTGDGDWGRWGQPGRAHSRSSGGPQTQRRPRDLRRL